MNSNQHVATVITYSGAALSVTSWGLHLSDIAAIVGALAALGGFGVQCWVGYHRVKLMKKREIDS